jgi:3-hydroxyisobutyrate dehydrogenase-like beta-hydroxyacid dehydrogenase
MKTGLVGLGKMGLAMAKRLKSSGRDIVAWDIDPAKRKAAEAAGIAVVATPAEVTAAADAIISIVTDDAGVEWLFTEGGLLAGGAKGKLFIEMTTTRPLTAKTVAALVEKAGGRFVGAPTLGSIPTVAEGKLFVLAGGADEDIARARVVLADLAGEVAAIGPLGAGNTMKLIANMMMAAYLEALAEGLAMGTESGLSLETMLGVLTKGPFASPWLATKIPTLLGQPGDTTLDIAGLRKDILSAVATGSTANVAMPLAMGILTSLNAAIAAGYAGVDLAELPKIFREHMVRHAYQAPKA